MSLVRTARVVIAAIGISMLGLACGLAQTPMVKAGGAEQLSPHVYVIADGNVGGVPNVGIIVGQTSTLVIDTGLGPRNGEIVLAEARRVSRVPVRYLVTTHVHPEHDLGAQAFPADTQMIRSRDEIAEIAEFGQTTADVFRGRSAAMKQLLEGAEFRPADVTFESDYTLDLGGVRVRLLAMGPNHTPGDTAVWIEQDGVLFAGDIAMKALPAFASPKSSLAHWFTSLDRLAALNPRVIVPSHGPIGDSAYLSAYREFMTTVRSRTEALKASGQSLEQVTQTWAVS
ncbi:MAG: MBL fold metallo-hydrolase [Vicinamibacterales bacterium]